MKKIKNELIDEIKRILSLGIHPNYTWIAVNEVIKKLNSLEGAETGEDVP